MSEKLLALGNNIKKIRKERGVTQEQLAEMVDRSKNHISKIELGLTNPPVSLIFDISEKLGVPPSRLFESHDDIYSDFNNTRSYEEISKMVSLILKNKLNEISNIL